MSPIIFVLLGFAGLLIWLGYIHGDTGSLQGFTMADRRAKKLALAFGSFTVVGAGEIAGTSTYMYISGGWSLLLFLGFALGIFLLVVRGKPIYEEFRGTADSLPDVVASYYGRLSSLLVTAANVIGLGALIVIQFAVGGVLLERLTGVSFYVATVAVALVVVVYVLLGGLKAIFFTDVVQGVALLIFLGIFATWALLNSPPDELMLTLERVTPSTSLEGLALPIALLVTGIGAISGGADIWQRFFASASLREHRLGFTFAGLLYLVFGFLLAFIALEIVRVLPLDPTDPSTADSFRMFLQQSIPGPILAAAAIGIFAALVSTADAELLVLSIIISNEAHRWGRNRIREVSDSRISVTLLAIAGLLITFLVADRLGEVFSALLYALLISGATAWVVLFNRGTKETLTTALFVAFGIFFWLLLDRDELGVRKLFVGYWFLLLLVPFLLPFSCRRSERIAGGHPSS